MKKLFCAVLALVMLCGAAWAETRQAEVMMEGEGYPVVETLYTSDAGVSFWYDAESLAVSEDGGIIRVEPAQENIGAYMEIVTAQQVGEAPWDYLAARAPEGTEYVRATMENGGEAVCFTCEESQGVWATYSVAQGASDWAAVKSVYPAEAAEGWGSRFRRIVITIRFEGDCLYAAWAEDVDYSAAPYTEITVSAQEPVARVALYTVEPVSDVTILGLTLESVGEDGTPAYAEEAKRVWGSLMPGQILIVNMTFEGDVPNNGVSFVDGNGVTHRYSFEISGEDGSLIMRQY